MIEYLVVLDRNADGRWMVACPMLPGCVSQGKTQGEALTNIREAIALYLRAVRKELNLLKHRRHAQVVRVAV